MWCCAKNIHAITTNQNAPIIELLVPSSAAKSRASERMELLTGGSHKKIMGRIRSRFVQAFLRRHLDLIKELLLCCFTAVFGFLQTEWYKILHKFCKKRTSRHTRLKIWQHGPMQTCPVAVQESRTCPVAVQKDNSLSAGQTFIFSQKLHLSFLSANLLFSTKYFVLLFYLHVPFTKEVFDCWSKCIILLNKSISFKQNYLFS